MTVVRLRTAEEVAKLTGHCERCGKETSGKDGLCRACRNGYGFPDPKRIPTEVLAAYIGTIKVELRRRRDEIDGALGDP